MENLVLDIEGLQVMGGTIGLIPDSAIEEIRMNLIQAFSPPNKVRMSIPHPCGMGLK